MIEFDQVYSAYFNDVFLYLLRLSQDEQIAEEITSETFFKAMRSIDGFRGECEIRVWLCQIAKNCYFSHQKRNSRTVCFDSSEPHQNPAEQLEEQLVRHEEAARVQKLLHDIPEPYKEVFMWRVFAEMSFKQIGALFGKSENWACVTYHRARNKLRQRLEDNYEK